MTVVDPTVRLEEELLAEHRLVIACDEVGRGALAGPVAIGAAVVSSDVLRLPLPAGLRDSKLVPEPRRPGVADAARGWALASAVGWADAGEIDSDGIMRAMGRAAHRALAELRAVGIDTDGAIIVLDGNHDYISPAGALGCPVRTVVKADRDCASAAAASVVAKVARDALMVGLHDEHPAYEWRRNKGYASAAHRRAIREHGLSAHHRASWAITDAPALW